MVLPIALDIDLREPEAERFGPAALTNKDRFSILMTNIRMCLLLAFVSMIHAQAD